MSRRKRLSEQTAQEIKDIARRLMSEKGTAGLSIRAIAREIEMTPPAIYTYFPNLDALITALIVDAFNAYADSLTATRQQHAAAPLTEQLMAVTMAYRAWAIENPMQFQLIYGSPIPGYEAPAELTVPAVQRTGDVFFALMLDLQAAGLLTGFTAPEDVPTGVAKHLRETAGDGTPEAVIGVLYDLYSAWMTLHGMVTLEVFNHLQGTVGDTEAFYRAEALRKYRELGLKV